MRKLIVSNIMSLDGYFEGPGKNVMDVFSYRMEAYPEDQSFDAHNAEQLRSADTLLLGRTMYTQAKSYWPSLADNPEAPESEQETSRLLNAIEKIVISDSLTTQETEPWETTTRIVKRSKAHTEISKLKNKAGKDILIFGSRTLWNDLLAHGLVDELDLLISPVVLGAGTPIFDGKLPISLKLKDTRTEDGSGLVFVRYEVSYKD